MRLVALCSFSWGSPADFYSSGFLEDVLAFIAERDDDEHLHKVRKSGAANVAAEVSTRAQDESALFEEDEEDEATEELVVKGAGGQPKPAGKSGQQAKSAARETPAFEGLRTLSSGSHKIQDIKELMRVPVSPNDLLLVHPLCRH